MLANGKPFTIFKWVSGICFASFTALSLAGINHSGLIILITPMIVLCLTTACLALRSGRVSGKYSSYHRYEHPVFFWGWTSVLFAFSVIGLLVLAVSLWEAYSL
jgi:hypothetical protein